MARETSIGDLDGDGLNEVVASVGDGNLRILRVDSTGGFSILDTIPLPFSNPGRQWISPKIVDVDLDGDQDIMTWYRGNNFSGFVSVAYNTPSGFQLETYSTPETDAGYRMAVGDFNADGYPDVFTVDIGFRTQLGMFVLYNDADPGQRFTDWEVIRFPSASRTTAPFVEDIDGDGFLDATVSTASPSSQALHIVYSDRSFQNLLPGDGTNSSHVAFGSVDLDGTTDIVINSVVPHNAATHLLLYRQLASRIYDTPRRIHASGALPKMPTFADFDGDGVDELVVSVTSNRTLDFFGRDLAGHLADPPWTYVDPLVASADHGFGSNPNVLTVGDVDNDGDIDILIGADRTIFVQNITDQPPVALCQSVTAAADSACLADAIIDVGSFDPDGDVLTLDQVPPSPYFLGETEVTLTASAGTSASTCTATVTVVDHTAPMLTCNAPATISPNQAPLSFTASAADNCAAPVVEVQSFACFKFTKKGKRIDKGDSCVVATEGDTVSILDAGGVGTTIEWEVFSTDTSGNATTATCSVDVVNPAHG